MFSACGEKNGALDWLEAMLAVLKVGTRSSFPKAACFKYTVFLLQATCSGIGLKENCLSNAPSGDGHGHSPLWFSELFGPLELPSVLRDIEDVLGDLAVHEAVGVLVRELHQVIVWLPRAIVEGAQPLLHCDAVKGGPAQGICQLGGLLIHRHQVLEGHLVPLERSDDRLDLRTT